MFHVIKRCRRLVPSAFTSTVSPALPRLELTAARRGPTLRRDFALSFSPCQRHCRVNSSQSVKTRWYSEQCSESDTRQDKDGDAAAVEGETTDIERRNERQGSAMVEASSTSHAANSNSHIGAVVSALSRLYISVEAVEGRTD